MTNLTDSDIIKALECCKIKTPPYKCEECPLLRGVANSCISECKELAYALINRQRAEIDGLQQLVNLSIDTQNEMNDTIIEQKARIEHYEDLEYAYELLENEYKTVKAEAIRELAEKLKGIYAVHAGLWIEIDRLVEEMVGEE